MQLVSPLQVIFIKAQQNMEKDYTFKKEGQMKPPYLILHKQSRILNTPNSVACVFDDIGSKCKMMYHFKISAFAGMTGNLTF